ncbi:MAG: hypothetical protein ACKPKO_47005 [Candidatus Fonsibacter sp.]
MNHNIKALEQQVANYRPDKDNLLVYKCRLMIAELFGGISSKQHAE